MNVKTPRLKLTFDSGRVVFTGKLVLKSPPPHQLEKF